MPTVKDRLPAFPFTPGSRINTNCPGGLLDRPPHRPTFGEQALRKALWRWERIVAQESDNAGNCGNRQLRMALFPVQDRPGIDSNPTCSLLLSEPQFESFLPDMLSQILGLKIRFLWFQ